MTQPSIVAVYGIPRGESGPVRLGTGSLEHERVVVLDRELSRLLASDHPPELLRVGIAGQLHDEPFVEVIEVRGVHRSDRQPEYAVELRNPARCPTVVEALADGPRGVDDDGLKNPICYVYETCSFC